MSGVLERMTGLVLAAAALTPAPADACTPGPSPTYTITALSPSPGSSGVVRDAGIIVAGVPSIPGSIFPFADVELVDAETDEAVPLATIAWFSLRGSDLAMAVHPVEPLAPLRAYRAEARLRDGFGNGAAGEPLVSNFETSDALLEPLVLSGALELALRGAEVDVIDRGPCDFDSRVIGKRRALFVDVQLPAPSGGQGVYVGFVDFSDNTPLRFGTDEAASDRPEHEYHDIRDLQAVNIQPGQALTLEQEVFEEDFAYAGCFNLAVTDPAGNVAQTSRCLPSLSPDEVRALSHLEAPLPIAVDDALAAEEVRRAAADYREEASPTFGCSFDARATAGTPSWLPLLLAASLAAARASRRR